MAYFRKVPKLQEMLSLFSKGTKWLIIINADPDAMASAMALRRIMARHSCVAEISSISEVSRPDNLSMVKYTRLKMRSFHPDILKDYTHFAMVDSQPHHNKKYENIKFSIIIDHHPLPENPYPADYSEIKVEYGSTSALLAEYLYNLKIRPGKLLATALQFGIKSDTLSFERNFCDADLRAYKYLAKFADKNILTRIVRSEFHRSWLKIFAKAWNLLRKVGNTGEFVYLGKIESPDILVAIADFLMRVYGINWIAASGVYNETVVVVFRGDGVVHDVGAIASSQFSDIGSAGGHKALARAEFPASVTSPQKLEKFIYDRVVAATKRG